MKIKDVTVPLLALIAICLFANHNEMQEALACSTGETTNQDAHQVVTSEIAMPPILIEPIKIGDSNVFLFETTVRQGITFLESLTAFREQHPELRLLETNPLMELRPEKGNPQGVICLVGYYAIFEGKEDFKVTISASHNTDYDRSMEEQRRWNLSFTPPKFIHPEIKEGESYIGNYDEDSFREISHATKRRGKIAYDMGGKPLGSKSSAYFPVFIDDQEKPEATAPNP